MNVQKECDHGAPEIFCKAKKEILEKNEQGLDSISLALTPSDESR